MKMPVSKKRKVKVKKQKRNRRALARNTARKIALKLFEGHEQIIKVVNHIKTFCEERLAKGPSDVCSSYLSNAHATMVTATETLSTADVELSKIVTDSKLDIPLLEWVEVYSVPADAIIAKYEFELSAMADSLHEALMNLSYLNEDL